METLVFTIVMRNYFRRFWAGAVVWGACLSLLLEAGCASGPRDVSELPGGIDKKQNSIELKFDQAQQVELSAQSPTVYSAPFSKEKMPYQSFNFYSVGPEAIVDIYSPLRSGKDEQNVAIRPRIIVLEGGVVVNILLADWTKNNMVGGPYFRLQVALQGLTPNKTYSFIIGSENDSSTDTSAIVVNTDRYHFSKSPYGNLTVVLRKKRMGTAQKRP